LDAFCALSDVDAGRCGARAAGRVEGQIRDSVPGRPQRQSGNDADVYCISQKSRTGDSEQTPAVRAGLPERQLNAEANQVVGGYQALEPGREFASFDWVAEP
jgi:hypothetical protein